jgi:hypothetical protein
MEFKYKIQHSQLRCICPPIDLLKSINEKAFRFVHEDINHNNNFLPPLIIEPTRIEDFSDCEKQCEGYALSIFNDFNKAEKKLTRLLSHKPLLKDVLGNCIAEGIIEVNDGLVDNPNHGHYNLHEYKGIDLALKFKIIKKIEV